MAFDSLGEYVAALRRAGELSEIRTRVSAHLEISEITDRVVKAGGPALLFTDVEGSPYPVLTNQFGSEKRMAMAFGARSLDERANRVRNAVVPNVPESTGARIAKLFSLGSAAFAIPRTVTDAPVQEVVEMGDDVDLVGDHEHGIEADAELADQPLAQAVLVFGAANLVEEGARAGIGDGSERRDQFVASHADAIVGDGQ